MKNNELPEISDDEYESLSRRGRPQHQGDYFSLRHPAMPAGKRAKIFAPFAALTGFSEEIAGKEKMYEVRPEKDEETIAALDQSLHILQERIRYHPAAEIVFFQPCEDRNHEAYGILGSRETIAGPVQEMDVIRRFLRIGGRVISFDDLLTVQLADV